MLLGDNNDDGGDGSGGSAGEIMTTMMKEMVMMGVMMMMTTTMLMTKLTSAGGLYVLAECVPLAAPRNAGERVPVSLPHTPIPRALPASPHEALQVLQGGWNLPTS